MGGFSRVQMGGLGAWVGLLMGMGGFMEWVGLLMGGLGARGVYRICLLIYQ
jgi:hypothetical protein